MPSKTQNAPQSSIPRARGVPAGFKPRSTLEELKIQQHYKIVIAETDKPTEQSYAFVGVNGINYKIDRGFEVSVPYSVLMVLKESIRTVYETKHNRETGTDELTSRKALSYPFNTLGVDDEYEYIPPGSLEAA